MVYKPKALGRVTEAAPCLYFLSFSGKQTKMGQIKREVRQQVESISKCPFLVLTSRKKKGSEREERNQHLLSARFCLCMVDCSLIRREEEKPQPGRPLGDLHRVPPALSPSGGQICQAQNSVVLPLLLWAVRGGCHQDPQLCDLRRKGPSGPGGAR